MAPIQRSPEFVALKRKQLDSKLKGAARVPSPEDGWIKSVRTALGMSAAQLGKRMRVSQQTVAGLEKRERSGSISISSLARAAEALNCELQIVFAPRTSLEATVRAQAEAKARAQRNRIVHTMGLEDQAEGVREALELRNAPDTWISKRIAQLWD
jgi:predicted DNA-binding mobile mystery protein A